MITVSVVDLSNAPRYGILDLHDYWNPGGSTGPVQYFDVPPILLSVVNAPGVHKYYYEQGSIAEGDEVVGCLRDKEVSHLNVSGELSVASRNFVYDTTLMTSGEYPRAKRTGTYTYVNYRSINDWGTEAQASYTCAWNPNVDSQGVFTRNASSYYLDLWFRGDLCYTISTAIHAPVFRNGAYYTAGYTVTYCNLWKRVAGSLRLQHSVSLSTVTTRTSVESLMRPYENTSAQFIPQMYYYDGVSVGASGALADAIATELTKFRGFTDLVGDESAYVDYGDLAVECAEQLKYVDANLIMLAIDINDWRNIHSMWKSVLNTKGWKSAVKAYNSLLRGTGDVLDNILDIFKPGSSLFLFEKYAVEPSVSDAKAISKGISKLIREPTRRRLHSRRVLPLDVPSADYGQFTAVITVETDRYPNGVTGKIQELIGEAKRWGIYPNLTALADLVKYSFVLNWFVSFGDVLKDVDTYLDMKNYFPVHHCVLSAKWEAGYPATVAVPAYRVTGQVVYSYYRRWITKEVPLPSVDPLRLGSNPFKHGVEMFALVLQRLPKSLG